MSQCLLQNCFHGLMRIPEIHMNATCHFTYQGIFSLRDYQYLDTKGMRGLDIRRNTITVVG